MHLVPSDVAMRKNIINHSAGLTLVLGHVGVDVADLVASHALPGWPLDLLNTYCNIVIGRVSES